MFRIATGVGPVGALKALPLRMAKRPITSKDLAKLEQLSVAHQQLERQIEALVAQAANYDLPPLGLFELEREAARLKGELVGVLKELLGRLGAKPGG